MSYNPKTKFFVKEDVGNSLTKALTDLLLKSSGSSSREQEEGGGVQVQGLGMTKRKV